MHKGLHILPEAFSVVAELDGSPNLFPYLILQLTELWQRLLHTATQQADLVQLQLDANGRLFALNKP
jgi:hypothetical protein